MASRLSAQSQVAASAGVLAWTEGVGRRALGVERVESDRGMGRMGGGGGKEGGGGGEGGLGERGGGEGG